MFNVAARWFLSYLVPIYAGQLWKDKQKERYYRVLSIGNDYVICRKLFFGETKHMFRKKEFRRGLYLIV